MSDPVALVHEWLDAFNARDVDRMVALTDPAVIVRPMRWVARREYRGHVGVREWLAAVLASPIATTVRPALVRAAGPERVIAEGMLDDGSGTPFTALYEIRGGRIASVSAFMSERALLEHLGVLRDDAGREP